MSSLKEIKGRIASVSNTLKITSAMKLVASAKLRRAQQAIGNLLPYEMQLHSMLIDLMGELQSDMTSHALLAPRPVRRVAIVTFSSNTSLCGAFNANVCRESLAIVDEYVAQGVDPKDITVYSIGKKVADAMKRAGYQSPEDYCKMAEKPSYEAASRLANKLLQGFLDEEYDRVELVYNHFKSTASQPTERFVYLPMSLEATHLASKAARKEVPVARPSTTVYPPEIYDHHIILEPSREALVASLLPKVICLRIYTALLDSNAAEHAARTVAMQIATDNGNRLLHDLTLEFNKRRQQKITNEILDIVGGSLR